MKDNCPFTLLPYLQKHGVKEWYKKQVSMKTWIVYQRNLLFFSIHIKGFLVSYAYGVLFR